MIVKVPKTLKKRMCKGGCDVEMGLIFLLIVTLF